MYLYTIAALQPRHVHHLFAKGGLLMFTPAKLETVLGLMRHLGLDPDPSQLEVLKSEHPRLLLNCARQAGKTTLVAFLGLMEALLGYKTNIFVVSRSMRQSREMFNRMIHYFKRMRKMSLERMTADVLELTNLSKIVCVPFLDYTIRGFSAIDLLVIDEAARVPDELYKAVRPMLAVSKGRLIALSTPYGQRGWFWDAWARGGDDWQRVQIRADQCPRIDADFLEQERRALGESWFRQEYCCSFESVAGLVYPDFGRCVVAKPPPHVPDILSGADHDPSQPLQRYAWEKPDPFEGVEKVGGIDFGFRNPFAAIWDVQDRDAVRWRLGEQYATHKPPSYRAQHLPRNVMWSVDPAGASEIEELRRADSLVRSGKNGTREGIAAVTARLEDGTLRILEG